MLLRVPVILAVTANSYGLSLDAQEPRRPRTSECQHHRRSKVAGGKPVAQR